MPSHWATTVPVSREAAPDDKTVQGTDQLLSVLEALILDPTFLVMRESLTALSTSVFHHSLYTARDSQVPDNLQECMSRRMSVYNTTETIMQQAVNVPTFQVGTVGETALPSPVGDTLTKSLSDMASPSSSDNEPTTSDSSREDTDIDWETTMPYPFSSLPLGFLDHHTAAVAAPHISMVSTGDATIPLKPPRGRIDSARPLRASFMSAFHTGPNVNSLKVVLYRTWLYLIGVHDKVGETAALSAFPRDIHPSDLPKVYEALDRACETGTYYIEFRMLVPLERGSYVYMRSVG
ncbi:hypothetical protein KIPB_003100 [Kipferlia bialata]|uniref:Uncharacterized protein n=1 Tax=Kipferlia bialata TaxID=797122 RepID=A0A9K3CRM0_9EUKA|nr:hypothetical protein KIPB_003100 [Kipferlia bialata]|eukprot:g3100.t1